MRRFEILVEKLNRKDLQDLKEEPRSILSSRSLRSSRFISLVLTATRVRLTGQRSFFVSHRQRRWFPLLELWGTAVQLSNQRRR